ncbi:hypothetical protein M407DRAFT_242412 [Tulasnella calospora MUT 4182]|uniref:Uncharacterized protein n=1 Tax=Tulasnella calospora MUT 4182 TaxID=1051891 RepID=A0A0C3QF22_9AGAM|nr:hypothetical protein M407DRAFT_242412 [Tulasnella calospora MUT 4182]
MARRRSPPFLYIKKSALVCFDCPCPRGSAGIGPMRTAAGYGFPKFLLSLDLRRIWTFMTSDFPVASGDNGDKNRSSQYGA